MVTHSLPGIAMPLNFEHLSSSTAPPIFTRVERSVFANVARGMTSQQPPAHDVELHRNRVFLAFLHGFRRLTMELDAAVLICPRWRTCDLLADEAVFRSKPIMRQFPVVEDTAEPTAKPFVLIVGHLQQSVFDSEGVSVIVVEVVSG